THTHAFMHTHLLTQTHTQTHTLTVTLLFSPHSLKEGCGSRVRGGQLKIYFLSFPSPPFVLVLESMRKNTYELSTSECFIYLVSESVCVCVCARVRECERV